MRYELFIEADTNDGDYITETHAVGMETLKRMFPITEAIAARTRGYNWTTQDQVSVDDDPYTVYSDVASKEELEWFSEFLPRSEYGIHTIETIKYYPKPIDIVFLV